MAKLTFIQLAEKVLQEAEQPLSVEEIWQIAETKGYDKEVESKGKTPWHSVGARLYVSVRDNPDSPFGKTATRPKRFFLRKPGVTQPAIIEKPAPPLKKSDYLERDLHPFVVYYGFNFLKAYLKTIRHNKSSKKSYGEWVHPDIVGCYFPFNDWSSEVVDLTSALGQPAVKLFSFELKRELTFANLREAFFQAVSNSSWAHEGYLAAAEISYDDDFRDELERLCSSFGIGVIKIDIEDPDSTSILIPAKAKDFVDWETVNKLTFNADFKKLLIRIKNDLSSKEIRREEYDQVLEKEDLLKSIVVKIAK